MAIEPCVGRFKKMTLEDDLCAKAFNFAPKKRAIPKDRPNYPVNSLIGLPIKLTFTLTPRVNDKSQ
jgi:hypothetical protein